MFSPIIIMLWRRSPEAGTGPGRTCGTGRKGRALRPPMTRANPGTGPQQASGDCPPPCRNRLPAAAVSIPKRSRPFAHPKPPAARRFRQ
jgi:hypothetical protein